MILQKVYLVLESGMTFLGKLENQIADRAGEVVFNTSHFGYEEIATDPSYFKQIVVMTSPMQGNYGADSRSRESDQVHIRGFVCLQIQNSPRDSFWLQELTKANVPVVSELDTRKLTLYLRSTGTVWGALVQATDENAAKEKAMSLIRLEKDSAKDWVWAVSQKQNSQHQGMVTGGPHIGLIDFGCKKNILRELLKRSAKVTVFPSRVLSQEVLQSGVDGVLLSNGPGDPSDVEQAPEMIKDLIGKKPIFGICMGHQVLALALGAQTYKLRFGHRGANHPIKDKLLNQVYISSQNHGYAVKSESLPTDVLVTQVNLNDQTLAGYYSEAKNLLGIQYHPESCPGPHDARGLFDFFVQKMVKGQEWKLVHTSQL